LSVLFIFNTVFCFCVETGYASWYGGKFNGRYTASGEIYDMNKLTAAHKTLPFGTYVKVINIDNGKSVIVKINDRGPFVKGRVIDLSRAGAEEIGMLKNGIARVLIIVVSKDKDMNHSNPAKKYSVQVGSYADPDNAARVKNFFEEKGFAVIIEKNKQDFHRIIIDSIVEEGLQALLKELSELGFMNVLVKQKRL